MIDYKLSEIAKICDKHFPDCPNGCPFWIEHQCKFVGAYPYEFYQKD